MICRICQRLIDGCVHFIAGTDGPLCCSCHSNVVVCVQYLDRAEVQKRVN